MGIPWLEINDSINLFSQLDGAKILAELRQENSKTIRTQKQLSK